MNDDLIRERWARYLGGEQLSTEERRELLEGLRENGTLREELLRDIQMHGLMRSLGEVEKDEEGFIDSVAEFMANERDGSRFVRIVDSRIKEQPAPAPRTRRRMPRRGGPASTSPWFLALAAAGMFALILGLFHLTSPTAPRDQAANGSERRRKLAQEREAAEAQRRSAEARKAAIERKQELLAQPDPAPTADPKAEEAKAIERARLAKEREQAEQDLREAIARARKADEELVRTPEKPRTEPTAPPKPEVKETLAEVARVGKTEGEAFLESKGEKTPVVTGMVVGAGQGLETGEPNGFVEILYPDQTRVDVAPGALVRELKSEGGKRFKLARGSVQIDAKKQPKGQPLVIDTPHGVATVVGTTLRILVEPGEKGFTRLEVTEGKVQLRNLSGKTVEVAAGYHAVATVGTELAQKPLLPETLALTLLDMKGAVAFNFGPMGSALPEGFLLDSGEQYDAKRGYGWKEPIVQVHKQMDGPRPQMTRMAVKSVVVKDPLRDTSLAVGWKDITQTWTMAIPNGRYLVTVCVGQSGYQQGPHHVWIEGQQAVDAAITRAGEFVEKVVRVDVKDLELTVRVGGSGKDFDSTSDTMLCFLVVRKIER